MFKFRQFVVNDELCAMKVGTDGVLLGAWASCVSACQGKCRILDVGAGCGLISLMLAQRNPQATLTALEIDPVASRQANENINRSPFSDRIDVINADFLEFSSKESFDAIVSNPPFFEEDLLPPDANRASARHTLSGLTFERLIKKSVELLKDGGSLEIIVPKSAQTKIHGFCNACGMTLVRATDVRTVERKAAKRVLLHFEKTLVAANPVVRDELILMVDGRRSEAYALLCKDFYL